MTFCDHEKKKNFKTKESMGVSGFLVCFLYGIWHIPGSNKHGVSGFLCLLGFSFVSISLSLEHLYSILCFASCFYWKSVSADFSFSLSGAQICDALISDFDAPTTMYSSLPCYQKKKKKKETTNLFYQYLSSHGVYSEGGMREQVSLNWK